MNPEKYLLLVLCLLLAACGQPGLLYLPAKPAKPAAGQVEPPPAVKPEPAKK